MAAKNPKRVAAGKKAWRTKVRKYGKAKAIRMSFGKRKSGRKSPRSNPGPRAPMGKSPTRGWGKWVRAARSADVLSGPAQGSVMGLGFTKAAGIDAANRYVGGEGSSQITPLSNMDTLKATYGGIGTGLVRDYARSKMGVYRGVGKNKLLSHVMAANPEILASGETSPLVDFNGWNIRRTLYDRAYHVGAHTWDIQTPRFWQSIGFDAVLKGFQMLAQKFINPRLPKGFNL